METLQTESPAARLFALGLKTQDFMLLDVGCSGGVHPAWRQFGDRLRAYAFDPSLHAIETLTQQEANPKVRYVAGFVGLPEGHLAKGADPEFWRVDPWSRLAAYRTQTLQQAREAQASKAAEAAAVPAPDEQDLMERNLWLRASLAEAKPIFLPDFLAAKGVGDVDFIKIDVDGSDFEILQSIGPKMDELGVLGVLLEVNFHGSAAPNANSFHNMDRYMREWGFDLLDLTVRKYALAHLPFPYLYQYPFASQSTGGRPFQGDALYLRDFGYPHGGPDASQWPDEKLVKLGALYAMFGLYDHAAEILNLYGPRLAPFVDVNATLNALAAEMQQAAPDLRDAQEPLLGYSDYLAAYEADAPGFYGAEHRIAAARSLVRAERDEARASLDEAHARLAAAEQTLVEGQEAHTQALEEKDRELAALKGSSIWRATAPVRRLADAVKRFRGKNG